MARRKTADGQTGLFETGAYEIAERERKRIATAPQAPRNDKTGERGLPRACGTRNDKKADGSVWEMKKRGSVGVISTAPYCGYSEATLRSLRERGWHLYKDGKRLD